MDALEQENAELRGEVTTLKADLERLNAMVESLVAAQNQPPPSKPPQTTPTTGLVAQILIAPLSAPRYAMPKATLGNTTTIPQLGTTLPQVTVAIPTPDLDKPIYDAEPTESVDAYGRWDDFQEQFDEMQREIKALCGKDLFGKNAHDLCLVPNVQIPAKFKVPEYEKYKGNTCPRSHLVMYARKISTQTDYH
ncbi:hypothetical protein QL285_088571 [Trifolium repens]|nr:hypothetical protein QL285_088571 [Trifolium repens]